MTDPATVANMERMTTTRRSFLRSAPAAVAAATLVTGAAATAATPPPVEPGLADMPNGAKFVVALMCSAGMDIVVDGARVGAFIQRAVHAAGLVQKAEITRRFVLLYTRDEPTPDIVSALEDEIATFQKTKHGRGRVAVGRSVEEAEAVFERRAARRGQPSRVANARARSA